MQRYEKKPPSCAECWVYSRTEWCVLSSKNVNRLNDVRRHTYYRRGETIFHQDDDPQGVYCLESGHVLLRHFDAFGGQTNFQLVKHGETIGWRSFFAAQPHAATAVALSRCNVCLIPGPAMWELLDDEPALPLAFLKTLARDRGPSEALMLRAPQIPVRIRLIHLLLFLSDRCATPTAQRGLLYDLPLKRGDMASMIGTRPETLSRAIRDLENESLAQFNGRTVNVPDPERLFEIVRQ